MTVWLADIWKAFLSNIIILNGPQCHGENGEDYYIYYPKSKKVAIENKSWFYRGTGGW